MENREVSALERLLHEGSDDDIRFFLLLRPADLADFLETVPEEDRLRVVRGEAPALSPRQPADRIR